MINEFGKFCRILRINRNEILGDMADKLDVSASFLSAVENGKRKIPATWQDKITKLYNLDDTTSDELTEAICASDREIRINAQHLSRNDRDLVIKFARSLSDFDEDKKNTFRNLFDK